jgi:hypothetical protein
VAVTEKVFVKKMNILMRTWARRRNQIMKAILKRLVGTYQV